MSAWRCPNCGTLQADSPRCFLCGRSATSCATCAKFRESLIDGTGYCALDRRREALTGAEQRACWTGSVSPEAPAIVTPDGPLPGLLDLLDDVSPEAHPPPGLRLISGH